MDKCHLLLILCVIFYLFVLSDDFFVLLSFRLHTVVNIHCNYFLDMIYDGITLSEKHLAPVNCVCFVRHVISLYVLT